MQLGFSIIGGVELKNLIGRAVLEKGMTSVIPERRLALIHRVIVPDKQYPKEYVLLVTDSRSIFIRQKKTRSSFVLRGEMRFGTALVTDVIPKTLQDYEQTSLESLTADSANLTVPHEAVISLVIRKEEQKFHVRDFFIWLTMRRQGNRFQVYDLEMNYWQSPDRETRIRFYMVPLGVYFKPRRQTKSRETILREYAMDALEIFEKVLPARVTMLQNLGKDSRVGYDSLLGDPTLSEEYRRSSSV